jgi:hypothetical protein
MNMAKEVVVYVAAGQLNADMIVAFLQSNGIDSYASMEAAGSVFGIQAGILGRAKVYVREEDEEEALRLLEAMEAGEMVLPEGVDLTAQYQQFTQDDDMFTDDDLLTGDNGVDPDDE